MADNDHHHGHDHGSGNGDGKGFFASMVTNPEVVKAAALGVGVADVGNLLIKSADIQSPLANLLLRTGATAPMLWAVTKEDIEHSLEEKDLSELLMHSLSGSLMAYGAAVGGKEGQEALHTGVLTSIIFRIAHSGEHNLKEGYSQALSSLREKIPGGDHAEFDDNGKLVPITADHFDHLPTVHRKKKGGAAGELEEVSIAALEEGDEIVVDGTSAFTVPVDGTISEIKNTNSIEVDASATTGQDRETMHEGSRILQMTQVPQQTEITIKVQKPWQESTGIKILTGLNGAKDNKANNETMLKTAVDRYTLALTGVGGLLFFKNALHKDHDGRLKLDFSKHHMKKSIEDTFGFVISAAPCAVAASMLIYEAVERELQAKGTIVQSRGQLEKAEKTNAVVFDITGTITDGKPEVKERHAIGNADMDALLQTAADLEFNNPHPIAKAILEASPHGSKDIGATADNGGAKTQDGEKAIGNIGFFERSGIRLDEAAKAQAEELEARGFTVSIVKDGDDWGVLALKDNFRDLEKTIETIEKLKADGKDVYLATGDNEGRAREVAEALKFSEDEIGSNDLSKRRIFSKQDVGEITVDETTKTVSPANPKNAQTSGDITSKVELLEHIKKQGKNVMMVGDGLNDALAMQYADVSVGMKESAVQEVKSTTGIMIKDLSEVGRLPVLSQKVNHAAKRNAALTGIWVGILTSVHFLGAKIEEVFHLKIGNTLKAVLHEAATVVATAAGIGEGLLLAQEFKNGQIGQSDKNWVSRWMDGKQTAAQAEPGPAVP